VPAETSHADLDGLFLSRVRLGLMSALAGGEELDFRFLKELLEATDGNLGAHLRKLEEAGMIRSRKRFIARRPNTAYLITAKGRKAFADYVANLAALLGLDVETKDA
jgi:DNA-binding MarR family transcriptional regulator